MPKKEESLSKNIEEYLEALYKLTRGGKVARTKEISEFLDVSPASVSEMLKKLSSEGYVRHSPYKGVTLTEKGLRIGEKVARRHRLLERFLYNTLKLGKDRVHREACELEHSISDEVEIALCRLLNIPDRCPDDNQLIPPCDLKVSTCEDCPGPAGLGATGMEGRGPERAYGEVGKRKENLVSVSELREGEWGRIAFLRGEHVVLRRLLDMGLTPGTTLRVSRIAPFGGPVEIEVRGSRLALGDEITSNVFVEPLRRPPEAE